MYIVGLAAQKHTKKTHLGIEILKYATLTGKALVLKYVCVKDYLSYNKIV